VYKIATSYITFKIYAEASNQCHSGSEAAPTLSQDCLATTVLKCSLPTEDLVSNSSSCRNSAFSMPDWNSCFRNVC